ncbi:hypothetical protein AOA80_11470, partial [Methanomassiliicoccales archaeon RumEn M1]
MAPARSPREERTMATLRWLFKHSSSALLEQRSNSPGMSITAPPSTTRRGSRQLMTLARADDSAAAASSRSRMANASLFFTARDTARPSISHPDNTEEGSSGASRALVARPKPEAYASTHPRRPQPHRGPSSSTDMWPK